MKVACADAIDTYLHDEAHNLQMLLGKIGQVTPCAMVKRTWQFFGNHV